MELHDKIVTGTERFCFKGGIIEDAAAELSSLKSKSSMALELQFAVSWSFVPGFKLVQDEEPCDTADGNSWKMQGPCKRRCFMDLLGLEE